MGADIRKKGKIEKVMERIKKVQEKVGAALRKAQEEIKQQVDRERKEIEVWKRSDEVILSTKDLVFEEWLARKLEDQYVGPYIIKK